MVTINILQYQFILPYQFNRQMSDLMVSDKLINTLKGHTNSVKSLAISPDNKKIVSGSFDKTIRVWDLDSGGLINTLTGHTHWVRTVAISPYNKK